MKKNYYQILEVNESAKPEQIKKAYRALATKYHPDRQQGSKTQMKLINEAYETLSDAAKRARYDRSMQSKVNSATTCHRSQARPRREASYSAPPQKSPLQSAFNEAASYNPPESYPEPTFW